MSGFAKSIKSSSLPAVAEFFKSIRLIWGLNGMALSRERVEVFAMTCRDVTERTVTSGTNIIDGGILSILFFYFFPPDFWPVVNGNRLWYGQTRMRITMWLRKPQFLRLIGFENKSYFITDNSMHKTRNFLCVLLYCDGLQNWLLRFSNYESEFFSWDLAATSDSEKTNTGEFRFWVLYTLLR